MNPEMEILSMWLNKNGFFILHSIPLPNNKIIDIIAIKADNSRVEKLIHIETACSISTVDNLPMQAYKAKFSDKDVEKKINTISRKFFSREAEPENILVIGNTSRLGDFQKLEGIKIVLFEDVLLDVLQDLNKQSYKNPVVRTLQLVKFLLISKPSKLAELLSFSGENKPLTHQDREILLKQVLEDEEFKQILGKKSMEESMLGVLAGSTLIKPEKLASALGGSLMTSRSKKKFQRLIISEQPKKKAKPSKPKEKSLSLFFEN